MGIMLVGTLGQEQMQERKECSCQTCKRTQGNLICRIWHILYVLDGWPNRDKWSCVSYPVLLIRTTRHIMRMAYKTIEIEFLARGLTSKEIPHNSGKFGSSTYVVFPNSSTKICRVIGGLDLLIFKARMMIFKFKALILDCVDAQNVSLNQPFSLLSTKWMGNLGV